MPKSEPFNDRDVSSPSMRTKPRTPNMVARSQRQGMAKKLTPPTTPRRYGHGSNMRLAVPGLLGLFLALGPTVALAATLTPILRRPAVNIYAVASTAHWCQRRVQLVWKARNPVLFKQPTQFLKLMQTAANRLRRPCPQADVAALKGVDKSDGVVIYRGKATRAGHWRPSPPFATAAQPARSSPPTQ